ncbi:hypothetical protein Tco_1272472 [Tanacetum coccineum]
MISRISRFLQVIQSSQVRRFCLLIALPGSVPGLYIDCRGALEMIKMVNDKDTMNVFLIEAVVKIKVAYFSLLFDIDSKPLPLIQNARGRQVILFDHFINNDLEYLKGGSLSQRYTTSIPKMKAAEYGHVKWIEEKVPRSIWSSVQVVYDKHAYWETYHWGPKRQSFYGYATNMETSKDVYSRHKIIDVASLKIMEFFGYKHLEEIIVQRQDDQLYKF